MRCIWLKAGLVLCLLHALGGCDAKDEYAAPETACAGFGNTPVSMEELKEIYQGETVRIAEPLQWEGYVVSSDATSNLFGEIYLQDAAAGPGGGLVFLTDLLESHARLPFGSKAVINLQGLYLGKSGGSFRLGGAFPSFGNLSVGRLPASLFPRHIRMLCDPPVSPVPREVALESLSEEHLNTLVSVREVEVVPEEVGLGFADPGEETLRTLQDCSGNFLPLRNSGYSDFHRHPLPAGLGTATGVLSRSGSRFELLLMDASDLRLDQPRCETRIVKKTSDQILISELADPDNLPEARFLELFNASDSLFKLDGWQLRRFTNANVEPGLSVALDGLEIRAGGVLVFSAYPEVFETTYGFPPDVVVPRNGPADSNGDDSMELIDPFGNTVDLFGQPGTDGSGTAHEFEDGRALRKPEIIRSGGVFDPSEWVIYNDSGGNGTLKEPQNAPEDFSPGTH